MTLSTTYEHGAYYVDLGWGLCSIPRGTKGPTDNGWNNPANIITSLEQVAAITSSRPDNGLGLVHNVSGTCAIDVDHLEFFRTCLEELGTSPEVLFAGAPRIVGNTGRDKAIFRLPAGEFKTHKLVWPPRAPGEKPTTIFELRTGAVQDVLPPTIHPDTHQPYRWRDGCAPWDLGGVPELPAELIAMWRDWDRFKVQLMAVCPWAPKPEAPKPRARSAGPNGNVIGQFNQAHDVAAILGAHGYEPKGRRWLAPTSSSKLAGVVIFEDGTHCFSHHASDPLNDGHAHDAFSVFCQLVHGGDMTAAVAAAADILGLNTRTPDPVPMDNVRQFMANSSKANRKPQGLDLATLEKMPPSDLLTVPGVLGQVVEYANRTAPKPQPQFAVQAALALGSVVLGRKWMTTQDNCSSLYFVNIGMSASGKEHPRTVIDRVLTAAGMDWLLGPGGYTSDGAVFSHLHSKPCHLSIIDELGELLGNAKAQGNFNKRQAITVLVQAWGMPHGTLRPNGYSTMSLTAKQRSEMESKIIHRPALSLMAMTTPDMFYSALDEQSIRGGFLNRLLIAESDLPPRVRGKTERMPVPKAVIDWCQSVRQVGDGNLAGMELGADVVPEFGMVDFTDEADAMREQYEAECIEEIKALRHEGLGEMQGRSNEKAQRLALIVALSVNPDRPLITGEIMRWCIRYVRHYTEQTIASIRKHMHGTQFAQWRASVMDALTKGGDRGRTEFELARCSRVFAGLEPRVRRSVLDSLKSDRMAAFVDMGKGIGGRGKSRQAWVALTNGQDDEVEDAA